LAAGCAEAGDFASAVKWQTKAIDLMSKEKHAKYQTEYEDRLRLYQSGKPYRRSKVGSLIAWWKFDDAESGNVTDSSRNRLNGKFIGDATIITDIERGNVLSLDGDGDYVDCGNNSVFDLTHEITIVAWIKVIIFDEWWQAIVTKGDSSWRVSRNRGEDTLEFACGYRLPQMKIVRGGVSVNDG
jgi:hypothetical protein